MPANEFCPLGVQLTPPPVLYWLLVPSFIELNKMFENCTLYIGMRVGIFKKYSYLFIYYGERGEMRK